MGEEEREEEDEEAGGWSRMEDGMKPVAAPVSARAIAREDGNDIDLMVKKAFGFVGIEERFIFVAQKK